MTESKAVSTKDEVVITPVTDQRIAYKQKNDHALTIAVAGAVVLFIVGLILGYLVGHQTARTDMFGDTNNFRRAPGRGGMPMYQGRNGTSSGGSSSSSGGSTSTNNSTSPSTTQTQ